MKKVFVCYRNVDPDTAVAESIAHAVQNAGHSVFIASKLALGTDWSTAIDKALDDADVVIATVSEASVKSLMVDSELHIARERYARSGRPTLIAIRLNYSDRLPYALYGYFLRFQHGGWTSEADTSSVVDRILLALSAPPGPLTTVPPGDWLLERQQIVKRLRYDTDRELQQSLRYVVRQELGLTIDAGLVARDIDAHTRRLTEPRGMDRGTSPLDVFDDCLGQLLILGAPGAGKSTMLLELADGLLDRAEAELALPVPVLFNLSSWAIRRKPIDQWMIAELPRQSGCSPELAQEAVRDRRILPLLDGLDEVDEPQRRACVEAINAYVHSFGGSHIVVTCRDEEYDAIGAKLDLRAALGVTPLTMHQVDQVLASLGSGLDGVRNAVRRDPAFSEAMRTPLMLDVVALACQDRSGRMPPASVPEVFDAFTDQMFRRQVDPHGFAESDFRRWLAWLAVTLKRANRTVFRLEHIGADWAVSRGQQLAALLAVLTGMALLFVWSGVSMIVNASLAKELNGDEELLWSVALFFIPTAVFAPFMLFRPAPLRPLKPHRPAIRRIVKGIAVGFAVGLGITLVVQTLGDLILDFFGRTTVREGLLKQIRRFTDLDFLYSTDFIWFTLPSALVGLAWAFLRGDVRPSWERTSRSVKVAIAVWGLATAWLTSLLSLHLSPEITVLSYVLVPIGVLSAGGAFAIWHILARLAISARGGGPLAYGAFLSVAVERRFLREAGGHYQFIHRLLAEHLAARARQ